MYQRTLGLRRHRAAAGDVVTLRGVPFGSSIIDTAFRALFFFLFFHP